MNAAAALPVMPATMHQTQVAYDAARAAYDAANAELVRLTADMPTTTDEELDAWAEASEAAYQALGMDRLFEVLGAAEDAMLAWSFEVARGTIRATKRGKARAADIAAIDNLERKCGGHGLQSRGGAICFRARTAAIDIALRLAA